ncbi:hypothetical protein ACRRTK_009126 [Alexandromys fortis]
MPTWLKTTSPGLAAPSTRRANSTDNRKTALTADEGSGSSLTGHQSDTRQNAYLPEERKYDAGMLIP